MAWADFFTRDDAEYFPSYPAPVVPRFDPLDYERLHAHDLRDDAEELTRTLGYAPSAERGLFPDQSLPFPGAWLLLVPMTVATTLAAQLAHNLPAIAGAVGYQLIALFFIAYFVFFVAGPQLAAYLSPVVRSLGGVTLFVAVVWLTSQSDAGNSRALAVAVLLAVGFAAYFGHLFTEHFVAVFSTAAPAPPEAQARASTLSPGYLLLLIPPFFAQRPAALLFLLIVPWIPATYAAYGALKRHPVFRSPLHLLGSAWTTWFTYGLRGTAAPGVLPSPGGLPFQRTAVTGAALFTAAAAFSSFRPFHDAIARHWPSFDDISNHGIRATALLFAIFDALVPWFLAAVLPVTILGSLSLALLASALPRVSSISSVSRDEQPPRAADHEQWENIVSRLQASTNPRIRRQLFVGFHATEHYPLFLPAPTLQRHVSISGATRSGKTSRMLVPLIAQLARMRDDDLSAEEGLRGPLVVIDLKGERAFFQAVRDAAERAERPFQYFSNHAGRGTFAFNPVLDLRELGILIEQVAATIHAGLNLEHGTGYGQGYYSSITRTYLAQLISLAQDAHSVADIFRGRERIQEIYPGERERREREREAFELISSLEALSRRPELNVTATTPGDPAWFTNRISMWQAIQDDAVIYFNLFSKAEEATSRFIGSLALECLFAATYRNNEDPPDPENPPPRKQVYAVIDEFQRVAGRNFGVFLEQAAGAGLSLILAKQSESQVTPELRDAIETNTNYRHYFSFGTAAEIDAAKRIFGETVYDKTRVDRRVTGDEPGPEDVVYDPTAGPRFHTNDLLALSALPGYGVGVHKVDEDFSQFHGQAVALYCPYHLSYDTYRELCERRLPVGEEGTLIVGMPPPKAEAPGQRARPQAPSPPPPLEDTELARAFARVQASATGYSFSEPS